MALNPDNPCVNPYGLKLLPVGTRVMAWLDANAQQPPAGPFLGEVAEIQDRSDEGWFDPQYLVTFDDPSVFDCYGRMWLDPERVQELSLLELIADAAR